MSFSGFFSLAAANHRFGKATVASRALIFQVNKGMLSGIFSQLAIFLIRLCNEYKVTTS